ncbi:hypothetical protein [Microtetraspora glauca]|uniref:Uncharacterized protein n=1 Tax=Microtetraspora glauca TaxID=1996 RepID=A0ABV3GSI7_MICGL
MWEYTAGWLQAKTALPNSTLLQPLEGECADYGIINHASWPNLSTFLLRSSTVRTASVGGCACGATVPSVGWARELSRRAAW